MKPLRAALENYDNIPYEGNVDVIYAREDKKPKFVYMYDGMCLQIIFVNALLSLIATLIYLYYSGCRGS